jgi:hypothetical protein
LRTRLNKVWRGGVDGDCTTTGAGVPVVVVQVGQGFTTTGVVVVQPVQPATFVGVVVVQVGQPASGTPVVTLLVPMTFVGVGASLAEGVQSQLQAVRSEEPLNREPRRDPTPEGQGVDVWQGDADELHPQPAVPAGVGEV